MKACPFCAEQIQDAAIVCRYCGRDIVDNFDKNISPKRKYEVESQISLKEYGTLLDAWGKSYSNIPDNLKSTNQLSTNNVLDYITPIFMEIQKSNTVDKNEFNAMTQRVSVYTMQWGIFCYLVGIEHGRKNIISEQVPYYLYAITWPLENLVNSFVSEANKSRGLSYEAHEKWASNLSALFIDQSVTLANAGFVGSSFIN